MTAKRVADIANAKPLVEMLTEVLVDEKWVAKEMEKGATRAWVMATPARRKRVKCIEIKANEHADGDSGEMLRRLASGHHHALSDVLRKKHGIRNDPDQRGAGVGRHRAPALGFDERMRLIAWSYGNYSLSEDDEPIPGSAKPKAVAAPTDNLLHVADCLENAANKVGALIEDNATFNRLSRELRGETIDKLLARMRYVAATARGSHRVHSRGQVTRRDVYLAVKELMEVWEDNREKLIARWAGGSDKPTTPAAKFVVDAMSIIDPERTHREIRNAMENVEEHRKISEIRNRKSRLGSTA